jgi:hypothetical protein
MHDASTRIRLHAPAALLLALSAAGCASTGATFGSGVGDTLLERPPFYAGARAPHDSGRVAYLPVAYQRGGVQAPLFDPREGSGTAVDALLREMNAYLDSLGGATRIAPPARGAPPDVRFSCETDPAGSADECKGRDGAGALGRGGEYMLLAVGRPSRDWVAATGTALDAAGAAHVLVVTLEVANYLPRQKGRWGGSKGVELGTGYSVGIPWLTSLETPVSVLQLTGALVDRDGRAVRIGAEGMLARRTPLLASALGAQAIISDEDVERLRTTRRDDLPGTPLVWQVALQNLVAELAGRG